MVSLLKKLSTEYETEYELKQYTKPKIYHGGKDFDLSKRWYVYYSYRNPDTDEFVRQPPIYNKINQRYKTKKERLRHFRALRNALENLLRRGESPYRVDIEFNKDVASALDSALEIKLTEVKETTYKDYLSRVNLFKDFLYSQGFRYSYIHEIDKRCVNKFLNTIKGAKNRNNTKAALSSVFSVLADQDLIETNFIKEIRNKKVSEKRVKIYTEDDVKHITNLLKKHDYTLLMFVYFVSYMFWRPIEIIRIKIKDIDFDNKTITTQTKTKSSKTKIIPDIIYSDLLEFTKHKKGFLFKPDGFDDWDLPETSKRKYFSRRFSRFRLKFNIDSDLKLYSFRHTFITKVYLELRKSNNKEDTIKILSLITGHNSKAIFKYIQVNDIELPEDYSELLK